MTNLITSINGVEIVTVEKEGEVYIPIKPICTAIGIDNAAQQHRISRHHILKSVVVTLTTTGTDRKQYEMTCLPLEYVYGWLFTIDVNFVSENVRERVAEYQRECYDALYRHFTGGLRRALETNQAEIELLQEINAAIAEEKGARQRKRVAEERLTHLRSERLSPQPTLFP